MERFPRRSVAALPGERVVDVEAVPADGERAARTLWEILVARRWLVLGFTTLVVALVAAWTFTARPYYESSAVIQIDPERPRVLSFADVTPREEPFNERVVDAYYQTQLELIASRTLLARVVDALDLRRHPALQAAPGPAKPLVAWAAAYLPAARPEPHAPATSEEFLDRLAEQVTIEPIRRSRLVRVTARVPDRELAARIPNQVAQQYIEMTNGQRRETSQAATRWLEQHLGALRTRTEQASGTIQKFVEQYNLVPTREGKAEFALAQLDELNRSFIEAENDRIQKEARYKMLAAADPDTLVAALGSELVRNLRAEYSRLERELGRAKTVYGPQHPKMIELEAELALARLRLDTEIKKGREAVEQEHQAAVRRAGELGRRLDAGRQHAIVSHARQMQLSLLKKEADSTEAVYAEMVKRLKELQIAAELQVTNVKIADAARMPYKPVSPKKKRDLALALVGGLLGGIALALVREAGDQTLRSPREVSLLIRLPNVGTIPSVRTIPRRALPGVDDLPARSIPDEDAPWPAQLAGEAFRSIRAFVLHGRTLETPRALLVTSGQPQEGKSFSAVNLAVALAEAGERVCLVDADLRRAACHRAFGIEPPSVGLSTILHRGLPPEVGLLATGVPNLTFLPAGPRPPDPSALLSSERARALFVALRERYPWVIVDSPPVLAVSDASVLASLVDGVLLVVRAHSTPIEAVLLARDRLEALGARMLGVVLNDVRLPRNRYFYASYGYQGSTDRDARERKSA
jgi:capsular exopolysaccharide synthesis family protein